MAIDLSGVNSAVYFTILEGREDPNYNDLARMPVNLAIVSPFVTQAQDGSAAPLSADMVRELKTGGSHEKLLFGYHGFGNLWLTAGEVAAAQTQLTWDSDLDGQPDADAPDWLGPANVAFSVPHFEGPAYRTDAGVYPEYYVKAWHPDWLSYIKGRIDQFADVGLDGIFLDVLDVANIYSTNPIHDIPGVDPIIDVYQKMGAALQDLRAHIETFHPEFGLVINASVTDDLFATNPGLAQELDGMLGENQSFSYSGSSKVEFRTDRPNFQAALDTDTPFFTVEYLPDDPRLFEMLAHDASTIQITPSISHDGFVQSVWPDVFTYTGTEGSDELIGHGTTPNILVGRQEADILEGGDANDIFSGGEGDDSIDGKGGRDVALMLGPSSFFDVARGTDGSIRVQQSQEAQTQIRITITANGIDALGEGPKYQVLADERQISETVELPLEVAGNQYFGPSSTHAFIAEKPIDYIEIKFINDVFVSPDENRDLNITGVSINGNELDVHDFTYIGGVSPEPLVRHPEGITLFENGGLRTELPDTLLEPRSPSVDMLNDVERLRFDDGTLAFDLNGTAGTAYRLYQAAFNREPDYAGLGFWVNELDRGASIVNRMAKGMLESDEFEETNGGFVDTESFVNLLYANILDREPDVEGKTFYIEELENQERSREQVLFEFSDSPENREMVSDRIADGIWYV